jgi:hypothetical protein
MKNMVSKTVDGFGREWSFFDQNGSIDDGKSKIFDDYFPFARNVRLLDLAKLIPLPYLLACYRDKSYYLMRSEVLDRFGIRLEKRFSKLKIKLMLVNLRFNNIYSSSKQPYWCAVGIRDEACVG